MNTQEASTVLIVDDEELVGNVTARLLMRAGFTVRTVTNGPDAITMIREGIPNLHAVLIDLSMPGMSGETLVQELSPQMPHTALILMSGYQPEMISRQYEHLGVKGFLQKPFTRETLYDTVRRAIAATIPPNE